MIGIPNIVYFRTSKPPPPRRSLHGVTEAEEKHLLAEIEKCKERIVQVSITQTIMVCLFCKEYSLCIPVLC